TVPRSQIYALGAAGATAILAHALFFKELLFVSYDPETAMVQGVGIFRYELLLNVIVAIVISVATRAVGALPVFGFTVVPAASAPPMRAPRGVPRLTQDRTTRRSGGSWSRRSERTRPPPARPRRSRRRRPRAQPAGPRRRCRSFAGRNRSTRTSAPFSMPRAGTSAVRCCS